MQVCWCSGQLLALTHMFLWPATSPSAVRVGPPQAERIVTALTQQLYCLPDTAGRALRDSPAASEKVLEASVSIFKQQPVRVLCVLQL